MEHYVAATIGFAVVVALAFAAEHYFGIDPVAAIAGAALVRAHIAESKAEAYR